MDRWKFVNEKWIPRLVSRGEGFVSGIAAFSFRSLPHWGRLTASAVDRVLSLTAHLRRSFPLSFIPLEPYPARFARHLPHAGKALMRGRRCSRFAVFPLGKAVLSFSALETHFPTLFHTVRTLSAPTGYLSHWKGKANGRSFEPTCASTNVCSQDHGEMFRINTRRFGF